LNVSGLPSPRFRRLLIANGLKFQQPSFVGMQFQAELLHPFGQLHPNLVGIRFALEANDDIIRESHNDHVAMR